MAGKKHRPGVIRAYAVFGDRTLGSIAYSVNSWTRGIEVDGVMVPVKRLPPLAIYLDEFSALLRMKEINDGPECVRAVEIRFLP